MEISKMFDYAKGNLRFKGVGLTPFERRIAMMIFRKEIQNNLTEKEFEIIDRMD